MVDLLLHKAVLAYQQQKLLPTRHLRIAYMLPHHNITGMPCALSTATLQVASCCQVLWLPAESCPIAVKLMSCTIDSSLLMPGGMKCLVEHIRLLRLRGESVNGLYCLCTTAICLKLQARSTCFWFSFHSGPCTCHLLSAYAYLSDCMPEWSAPSFAGIFLHIPKLQQQQQQRQPAF